MPQPTTPSHPNRLRELREAAGESRVDVAFALGLKSDKQVDRWEAGESEIRTPYARALATRYAVTISYLLRDERAA